MGSTLNGSSPNETLNMEKSFDALIVGAGFSGLHMLSKLRQHGFSVRLYESGSDLGGVWYWNSYPGARVDFDCQTYQFSQDGLWKDFQWSERFPAQPELRKYFKHVDQKLNLSTDIQFNTNVTAATFHESRKQWLVATDTSAPVWTNHLILCTGSTSKRYTPEFKGLDDFKGQSFHTASWPKYGVDLKGKRVAVIGTGASGVQVIQEIGPDVSHLTVYQRTPNIAFPMQQYSAAEKAKWVWPEDQEKIFAKLRRTFNGSYIGPAGMNALEATPEERQALFEELYRIGGLAFMIGNYKDLIVSKEANAFAYQFWREKTMARITDPYKRELLAPLVAPHFLGTKRPSLEQRYYEVFNQENVDIINVKESPIIRITQNGIETEKEGVIQADVIVCATGFDCITGGILNIEITNGRGQTIRNKWNATGVSTCLGISTSGFPNIFFLYGPQAPTPFANGPVCAEIQGDWIVKLLVKMRNDGNAAVEATKEAEDAWVTGVHQLWNSSLLPHTKSWYQGSNIPGKPNEPLCYTGGIPLYIEALEECKNKAYQEYVFT